MPPGACVIFSDTPLFASSPGSLYLSNLYLLTDSFRTDGNDRGIGSFASTLYVTSSVITSSSICLDFVYDFFAEGARFLKSASAW